MGVSAKSRPLAIALAVLVGSAAAHAAPATRFKESIDGVGHFLLVPYYTAQPGFATLLNLVNSDREHGKVVKVRFRGASNADDVYNFTLFLRPGDVWAGEVSHNPATGLARLSTPDESCTLPRQVAADFSTAYVNPAPEVTHLNPQGLRSEETLEGYVELITMADVVPGTALDVAITNTHNNFAPCRSSPTPPAVMDTLLTPAGIAAAGLGGPTTGLMGQWSIFNVAEASSWSGRATALVAVGANNVPGLGNVVMHPQAQGTPPSAITSLTSDPLLRSGGVTPQHSSLPDLSTPYLGSITPEQQAAMLSGVLAKASVKNEFFIDKTVQAQTDWVISLPLMRYSVAFDYARGVRVFTTLTPEYFNRATTERANWYGGRWWSDKKVCLPWLDFESWDRWGNAYGPEDGFSIGMPLPPGISVCGAVSVGGTGALQSKVAHSDAPIVSPRDGWTEVFTPGINQAGLPILGAAFAKATSTNVGSGVSGNFGLTWEHSYTRPGNVVP